MVFICKNFIKFSQNWSNVSGEELSYYLPLQKGGVLHLIIVLCAKFPRNWPSSSEEEDFKISSMYFTISLSSPLGKGWGPSFEQT